MKHFESSCDKWVNLRQNEGMAEKMSHKGRLSPLPPKEQELIKKEELFSIKQKALQPQLESLSYCGLKIIT